MRKSKWHNLQTNVPTMMLNITSKNVGTYWVSAPKLAIQTILKLFSIIYFRRSSNTRVPPPLEVLKVKFTQTWLLHKESTEELPTTTLWVPWTKTKGQTLSQVWAAIVLQTLLWPTLICKTVPVNLMVTLTVPTLSSSNCIDKLYKYKSRLSYNRRYYYMCLFLYLFI